MPAASMFAEHRWRDATIALDALRKSPPLASTKRQACYSQCGAGAAWLITSLDGVHPRGGVRRSNVMAPPPPWARAWQRPALAPREAPASKPHCTLALTLPGNVSGGRVHKGEPYATTEDRSGHSASGGAKMG